MTQPDRRKERNGRKGVKRRERGVGGEKIRRQEKEDTGGITGHIPLPPVWGHLCLLRLIYICEAIPRYYILQIYTPSYSLDMENTKISSYFQLCSSCSEHYSNS